MENNNTCYLIGLDSGTVATLTGATISGNTLSFASASGTVAVGQQLADTLGHVPGGLSILSGSGTTWTITNPGATISTPQTMTTVGNDRSASGFAVLGNTTEGNWISVGSLPERAPGFILDQQTCRGISALNAGMTTGILGTLKYAIARSASLPNKATYGVFMGLTAAGDLFDVASLSLGTSISRASLLFMDCHFSKGASGTGVDVIPANQFAYIGANFQCHAACLSTSFRVPVWTYCAIAAEHVDQRPRG